MCSFVIFCLARTGSTTLMRILNQHPRISCLNEPFNFDCHPEYALRIVGPESLYATLDEIYKTHNGIRHVVDPNGWPFANSRLNYNLLACKDYKFIFLKRSNALKRVVSREIAQQMNVWHFWKASDRSIMHQFVFKPFSITELDFRLKAEKSFLSECTRRLQSSGTQYCELAYERLFGNAVKRHEQLSIIDEVVAFLGMPALAPDQRYEVSELLEPSNTGFDSQSVYHRIPNIDKINNALGCDDTGWLFE